MLMKSFNIAVNAKMVLVSCYVSPEFMVYLARLDNELTAIIVSNGHWRSYGGDEENLTLKSAIMEWNAIGIDNEAKLNATSEPQIST